MRTKNEILTEIKRQAKLNGGQPLGRQSFEKESDISSKTWQKHWPNFGLAIKEAGFEPNSFQSSFDNNYLIEQLIKLSRKLGRFPTMGDIRVEHHNNAKFPSTGPFETLGLKKRRAEIVVEYCRDSKGFEDVIEMFAPILTMGDRSQSADRDSEQAISVGIVYMFQSGKFYKIGMSKDTVRRGKELRLQLPENPKLIHEIKTDDPSGVEAYWHRRFSEKRQNDSEFYRLTPSDVRAFKRWRRIW